MTFKFLALTSFIAMSNCLCSCSNNPVEHVKQAVADFRTPRLRASSEFAEKKIEAGKFSSVSLNTFANLEIVFQKDLQTPRITLRSPENLVEEMVVESQNGVLIIDVKGDKRYKITNATTPVVQIAIPTLVAVSSAGSGDILLKGDLMTDEFSVSLNGSGDLEVKEFKIDAKKLNLKSSGTGDIDISDLTVTDLYCVVHGTGDIDVEKMTAVNVEAYVNSTGDIDLTGSANTVRLELNGTGDIDAEDLSALRGRATVNGTGSISCNVNDLEKRLNGIGTIHNLSENK